MGLLRRREGLICVLLLSVYLIQAQHEFSDNYLYPIQKKEQLYSDKGIDWILRKQDSTQFYLFGEQHGISEIPLLIGFIHKALNKKKRYVLALEMDEWSTGVISDWGIDNFTSSYPHSIAFDYDEEIELIRSARRYTDIWGLDQMITAIHPYQHLIKLAPDKNTRRLARGAFLKASLKMGRYLKQPNQKDIETIKEAFGDELPPEVKSILGHLKKSMEIYTSWHAGQRGEISKQISVTLREQFMMEQFDGYMDKYSEQNVIVKMGGAHMINGIGPNGVETLGNHIKKRATKPEHQVVSIGLFNYHKDLQFVTKDIFKESDIVLLDCKEYLQKKRDSLFVKLPSSEKLLLEGYDAMILFNNVPKSRRTFVNSFEKQFKRKIIQNLIPGGVLVLLGFFSSGLFFWQLFSKSDKTNSFVRYKTLLIQAFVSFILAVVVFGFQIYVIITGIDTSTIIKGFHSLWLYFALLGIALFLLFRMILFIKSDGAKSHKARVGSVIIYYLLLTCFMYYWNIGGMISL